MGRITFQIRRVQIYTDDPPVAMMTEVAEKMCRCVGFFKIQPEGLHV